MCYELSDCEWTAIKTTLPNKPRGVRRVNDRRVLVETYCEYATAYTLAGYLPVGTYQGQGCAMYRVDNHVVFFSPGKVSPEFPPVHGKASIVWRSSSTLTCA